MAPPNIPAEVVLLLLHAAARNSDSSTSCNNLSCVNRYFRLVYKAHAHSLAKTILQAAFSNSDSFESQAEYVYGSAIVSIPRIEKEVDEHVNAAMVRRVWPFVIERVRCERVDLEMEDMRRLVELHKDVVQLCREAYEYMVWEHDEEVAKRITAGLSENGEALEDDKVKEEDEAEEEGEYWDRGEWQGPYETMLESILGSESASKLLPDGNVSEAGLRKALYYKLLDSYRFFPIFERAWDSKAGYLVSNRYWSKLDSSCILHSTSFFKVVQCAFNGTLAHVDSDIALTVHNFIVRDDEVTDDSVSFFENVRNPGSSWHEIDVENEEPEDLEDEKRWGYEGREGWVDQSRVEAWSDVMDGILCEQTGDGGGMDRWALPLVSSRRSSALPVAMEL